MSRCFCGVGVQVCRSVKIADLFGGVEGGVESLALLGPVVSIFTVPASEGRGRHRKGAMGPCRCPPQLFSAGKVRGFWDRSLAPHRDGLGHTF